MTHASRCTILLTGSSGFIGKAIVKELLAPDSPLNLSLIRIFDINPYRGESDPRIETVTGDIRDYEAVTRACEGIDVVIHAAAIVDWGTQPEEVVYSVNFTGTENIVNACLANGVKHLVYTSSLDAIYEGKPLVGIDETIPYPAKHPNMYCRSKYLAEKLVLEANNLTPRPHGGPNDLTPRPPLLGGEGAFSTCVLRPADVYGPADPFHIGSLIDMAKGGFYVRLGDGTSKSQHVFVGNIARAHVEAAAALLAGNPAIAGQAYFITDGAPSNFFHFFDAIVEGAGYPVWPKNLWIPRPVAYAMGALAEFFALIIRPVKKYNPKFSRFAVMYTCSDFTFNTNKAQSDFGFTPKYSKEEAFQMTVDYFRRGN